MGMAATTSGARSSPCRALPILSVSRAAALPVGATSRMAVAFPCCRPVSTRMASSLATVVVLPVPGPPEMTAKGRAAAVAAASFWPLQQSASGTRASSALSSLAAWALASRASTLGQSTSSGYTRSRYFSTNWRAEKSEARRASSKAPKTRP
ncbi:hypothetical protein D3C79_678690 [compost metagenome]